MFSSDSYIKEIFNRFGIMVYLGLFLFLIQSCKSYKTIDIKENALKVDKKYKIRLDEKFVKAKLISFNDSIANFRMNKTEREIPLSEIKELKSKRFSVGKTLALVTPALFIAVLAMLPSWNYSPQGNTMPH